MNTNKPTDNLYTLICDSRTELMGMAALLILFFHTWTPIMTNVPILGIIEDFAKRTSFLGVDIFFFLSGMGLVASRNKYKLGQFYYRRLRRLILPFILVATIRLAVGDWSIEYYLKAISFAGFLTKSVYYFLWFVPAIILLYASFPAYYYLATRTKSLISFFLISLEIWLFISVWGIDLIRTDIYSITNRIPIFLLGTFIAMIQDTKFHTKPRLSLCLVTLITGLLFAYATNYKNMFVLVPFSNCFLPNVLVTLSLCPLVSVLFSKIKTLSIPRKMFRFIGTISFELYCVQDFTIEVKGFLLSIYSPIIANIVIISLAIISGYMLLLINKCFIYITDIVFQN